MKKDYFGIYDPTSAGHMGYNWRQTIWYPGNQSFYGVHGNSGYLFQLDPRAGNVNVIDRITSQPSKRSGMFDQFSYGYLGFILGPDQHTLYYLTGGPVYLEGKTREGQEHHRHGRSQRTGRSAPVTYDIPAGKYRDRGPSSIPTDSGPVCQFHRGRQ